MHSVRVVLKIALQISKYGLILKSHQMLSYLGELKTISSKGKKYEW